MSTTWFSILVLKGNVRNVSGQMLLHWQNGR